MNVQDPLKPFNRTTDCDPRYVGSGWTLEQLHIELDVIKLNNVVPIAVRQLFETAKQLSLHSWFVFRFHPIAELVGYIVLERALRERVAIDRGVSVDAVKDPLHKLTTLALERKWLVSERFSVARQVARVQLSDEQTVRMIQSGEIGDEPVKTPEIDQAAILARASELDYVHRMLHAMRQVRNHFSHHAPVLHGASSTGTLRRVAEAVNQLFDPETACAPRVPLHDRYKLPIPPQHLIIR